MRNPALCWLDDGPNTCTGKVGGHRLFSTLMVVVVQCLWQEDTGLLCDSSVFTCMRTAATTALYCSLLGNHVCFAHFLCLVLNSFAVCPKDSFAVFDE